MNDLAADVTPGELEADAEPLTAEWTARVCGTRAPGVLDLLGMLGIDLLAGPPEERPEPVPVIRPNAYRKSLKTRRKR